MAVHLLHFTVHSIKSVASFAIISLRSTNIVDTVSKDIMRAGDRFSSVATQSLHIVVPSRHTATRRNVYRAHALTRAHIFRVNHYNSVYARRRWIIQVQEMYSADRPTGEKGKWRFGVSRPSVAMHRTRVISFGTDCCSVVGSAYLLSTH